MTVAVCRTRAGCTPRLDMTVAQFADWWTKRKAGEDARLLYLKDWHFAAEFPGYKAYTTPEYFQEDWLNDFFDMRRSRQQTSNGTDRCTDRCTDTRADSCKQASLCADTPNYADSVSCTCTDTDSDSTAGSMLHEHAAQSEPSRAAQAAKASASDANSPSAMSLAKNQAANSLRGLSSQPCQLATVPAGEEVCAAAASAATKAEACGVECSDYRFVYLGCQVT